MPVICSDSNGTRCYIRDGVNGRTFRSGSLDDLRRVIFGLEDRERLKQMGERSLEVAHSVHGPNTYVDRLEEIVDQCWPQELHVADAGLESP